MKHLFPEEQQLTAQLSEEWKREVLKALEELTSTFSRKSSERDKADVVWRRIDFPGGFLTVIHQKLERFEPLLSGFTPKMFEGLNPAINTARWPKIREEALDIATYLIFMAAITSMFERRLEGALNGEDANPPKPFPVYYEEHTPKCCVGECGEAAVWLAEHPGGAEQPVCKKHLPLVRTGRCIVHELKKAEKEQPE